MTEPDTHDMNELVTETVEELTGGDLDKTASEDEQDEDEDEDE